LIRAVMRQTWPRSGPKKKGTLNRPGGHRNMASLTVAQLLTLLDKTHEQVEEMWSVCGTKDAGVVYADRPSKEYNKIMEAIFEEKDYISDPSGNSLSDGQIRELLALYDRAWELWSYTKFSRMQLLQFMRIVDMHLRTYGDYGINAKLSANDERVGYWLHATGFPLDARNVFPPGQYGAGTGDMGVDYGATWNDGTPWMSFWTADGGGIGSGTYTAGNDIDTDLYGKSNLLGIVGYGSTAYNNVNFDVTCLKIDGTTEVRTMTFSAFTTGTKADVGTHDTDMYVGITDISPAFSAPTYPGAGEWCYIVSELERFTKIT